jgi:hypothetical protein
MHSLEIEGLACYRAEMYGPTACHEAKRIAPSRETEPDDLSCRIPVHVGFPFCLAVESDLKADRDVSDLRFEPHYVSDTYEERG